MIIDKINDKINYLATYFIFSLKRYQLDKYLGQQLNCSIK